MKGLSHSQLHMLGQVSRGYCIQPDSGPRRPFQIGNTNRTADALEARGMITPAEDQREARKTLSTAWELTALGRMKTRERETIPVPGRFGTRRFIFYPASVTDGTLRCIGCGQIDEDGYHDMELHEAVLRDLRAIQDGGPAR